VILTDSRLKIDRANKHIADIESRIVRLHETDTATVDIDPKTSGEILTHTFTDTKAFDDIALMLGDAVHNLNCALDYTWLQTIERLIPALIDDRAKFPVRKEIKELEGWMTKAGIDTASPELFRFVLDKVHPCDGGDEAIWPIHNLDIRDKHRLLIPVLSTGHIEGIRLIDEHGEMWRGDGSSETIQRPPYIIPYPPGLHIKDKGKLTAVIIVEVADSRYLMHIPETMKFYSGFILRVIERFEKFLDTRGF
jgi:hypothetical protein